MKILFFSPANSDLISSVSVPLGLLSMGTYLKEAGHTVKIVDLAITRQSVAKVLKEYAPDICGVSVRSPKSVRFALDISKKIRKWNPDIPIVWGGPFCDNAPAELFFDTGVIDIISFGEGEMTWLDLADMTENKKKLEDIKGIAFKCNEKLIRTAEREFMDLCNVKPVDWSLVDVPKYFQYLFGCKKLVYLYHAKGCPSKCTFCYNPTFHRSCYRKKSLAVFMQELKYLVENYGLDGFYLADEIMFYNKEELYEFCDALDKTGYNLMWGGQTRIGRLNKADFKRLYDSGFRWIDLGIESGSKRILGEIKKGIPYDMIKPTFEWCNELGLFSMTNFIIGLPGETPEDMLQSVKLAKEIKASTVTFGLYCFNYSSEMGAELYKTYKDRMPKKLADYNKNDFYINTFPNFSLIPKKDKVIVQGYFMWKQLKQKNYTKSTKKFEMLVKHILAVSRQLPHVGIRHMPESIIKTYYPFLRFFITANFCKKTLKKYSIE